MNINQYIQKKLTILLISILLIGCKPQPTCQNITINNTVIEYRDKIIEKEIFIDRPCNCSNETIYIGDNCLPLINQIKRLENIINKWAVIDINITINETNSTNTTGGNST